MGRKKQEDEEVNDEGVEETEEFPPIEVVTAAPAPGELPTVQMEGPAGLIVVNRTDADIREWMQRGYKVVSGD